MHTRTCTMLSLGMILLACLLLAAPATAAQAPLKPLADLTESNVEAHLGTALAVDRAWTLQSRGTQGGQYRTMSYALSESASCFVTCDPATGAVLRINFLVAKKPEVYRENADHIFNNEIGMAIRAAGNLFLELKRNPGLADDMQRMLSFANPSIKEGKTVLVRPDDARVVYTARSTPVLYGLAVDAGN